ncbi:hypothetical protein CGLO_11420 [Colletotrichum gloeosporioides Cg-14]|uniref:Uncharacterized protein n=1 Tax=Colletotrichum gloeosporioides (strain Cg-14) TaxID=1237896 RepID=T0KB46_COLGC|nr:hypothetical protein CGLO_11420 [Colletotrichum gloeosporioides Cg-14]
MADAPQCNCPKYETQDSDGKPVIIYRHGDACPNSGKTPQPRIGQISGLSTECCVMDLREKAWLTISEDYSGWAPEISRTGR